MPLERIPAKQRMISFTSLSSSTRQTPHRNKLSIQNYSQIERIDEPIENPPKTPRVTTLATQDEGDEDIEMADGDQGDDNDLESNASKVEEIEVQMSEILTRRNIPSTITIKKSHKKKKTRKPREETTWTRAYFDVT